MPAFSRASGAADRLGDFESNASTAPSAFAHGTGAGISAGELAQVVEGFVGQFAHQAPFIVLDSAVGVLAGVSQGDAVAGAVHRGWIHLFLDQIPSRTEAIKTLWHEMLHDGLRRFLTKEQFIAQMLDLATNDMWIRTEARGWANSKEGQRAKDFCTSCWRGKSVSQNAERTGAIRAMLSDAFGGDSLLFWSLYRSIWPDLKRSSDDNMEGLLGLQDVEMGDIDRPWQFVTEGWIDFAEE